MAESSDGRRVLLVGSLPYQDEASAMARAVELIQKRLIALPDGEVGERSDRFPTGERSAWVVGLIERLKSETELFDVVRPGEVNEQGLPVNFRGLTRLRPKLKPDELGQRLHLGYDRFALSSWPHFQQLRDDAGNQALRFQIGFPSALDAAFTMLGPLKGLRYYQAYAAALARDGDTIAREVGAENLLFQIEAPAEVIAAHKLPKPLVRLTLRPILNLVRRLDPQVPIGIHMCFGDLNNESPFAPKSADRLVYFAQQLVNRWPSSHSMAYIHMPFAAGKSPPPTKAKAYRALRDLKLPPGTRLVAGFAHEQMSTQEQAELLGVIEEARGGPVDIATACGLGRRPTETADLLLQRCAELASAS